MPLLIDPKTGQAYTKVARFPGESFRYAFYVKRTGETWTNQEVLAELWTHEDHRLGTLKFTFSPNPIVDGEKLSMVLEMTSDQTAVLDQGVYYVSVLVTSDTYGPRRVFKIIFEIL